MRPATTRRWQNQIHAFVLVDCMHPFAIYFRFFFSVSFLCFRWHSETWERSGDTCARRLDCCGKPPRRNRYTHSRISGISVLGFGQLRDTKAHTTRATFKRKYQWITIWFDLIVSSLRPRLANQIYAISINLSMTKCCICIVQLCDCEGRTISSILNDVRYGRSVIIYADNAKESNSSFKMKLNTILCIIAVTLTFGQLFRKLSTLICEYFPISLMAVFALSLPSYSHHFSYAFIYSEIGFNSISTKRANNVLSI